MSTKKLTKDEWKERLAGLLEHEIELQNEIKKQAKLGKGTSFLEENLRLTGIAITVARDEANK